ncbi:MAG: SH3 domain-containing protein [Lachnospiraceae bacterium]|nr:SH3 domain-containing protein [Lachnospiraceae bacterium]
MSNRTINRILISVIGLLCVTICILVMLIITRPQHVLTQGASSPSIEEVTPTEIIDFGNTISEDTSIPEESTVPTSTQEQTSVLYARTTSLLNIRASNSTDAAVVETVSENTILQVLEIQPDGWTKILYEGQEAYVSSAYIILVQ